MEIKASATSSFFLQNVEHAGSDTLCVIETWDGLGGEIPFNQSIIQITYTVTKA
jgi:hypothetical protein